MDHNTLLRRFFGDPMEWFCQKTPPARAEVEALIAVLEKRKLKRPDDPEIDHCMSDAYFLIEDYPNALRTCPRPALAQTSRWPANRRLNLCLLAGEQPGAADWLALFEKRITRYGREHIDQVARVFCALLAAWETDHRSSLLAYIVRADTSLPRKPHFIFNATVFSRNAFSDALFYDLRSSTMLEQIVVALERAAENVVREDNGLPRIGEGWISEVLLFEAVKQLLPQHEVILHGRPPWLGKQHLDVFIPDLALALEYQGEQHYRPVPSFGGEEGFRQRQQLDQRKRSLCAQAGVTLIEVQEGYAKGWLEEQIRQALQQAPPPAQAGPFL